MMATTTTWGDPPASWEGVRYWLLATGARCFTDGDLVRATLIAIHRKYGVPPERMGVTHGAARGADALVDSLARALGWVVDPVPCTREEWDRYGPSAGHRRNARMISRHDYAGCVAFPQGLSAGTRGCVVLAEDAGIRVWNRGDPPLPDGWYQAGNQGEARFRVARGLIVRSPPGSRRHHARWWDQAAGARSDARASQTYRIV